MTTSVKRKKRRKLLRIARDLEDNKLPENCLSCEKDMFSSIHHFFCDKCWKSIHDKMSDIRGNDPAKWCLICGRNILESTYQYLCETHGKKIEKHHGKTLARKRITKNGTGNVPFFFDFCRSKR